MGIGYNLGDTILHSFKGDDMKKLFYLPMIMIFILSACVSSATSTAIPDPLEMKENVSIEITSSAFTQGGSIPDQYTCKGKDISPPLAWGEPPAGTKSFALIMDDPDAPFGTWDHWILFNIPVSARSLPESIGANPTLPDGSMSGKNS